MIAAITTALMAAAAAYSVLATPLYESVATLRLSASDSKGGMLAQLSPLAGMGLPGFGDDDIDTEVGVLRSREVADAVAEQVGLQVQLIEPRRPRSEVLNVVRAPGDQAVGRYVLTRQADGSYTARAERSRGRVSLPERVQIGKAFRIEGVVLSLAPGLRTDAPKTIRFEVHPFRRAVAAFREEIVVERQEGRSRLLEVSYRSSDPVLAAAAVNAVAANFIHYKRSTSHTESRSTVDVLREQIALYAAQLRDAEDRLQGFQEQQRVIAPGEEADQQVRRLAEIQVKRDQMQVERASLSLLLQRVNSEPRQPGESSPYRQLATFPSFISNRAVQDILETLTKLESERSTLLVRRTEQNVDAAALTARIDELETQLHTLATSYLANLDGQIASASGALNQFGGEMERMPARAIEFARLTREQKLLSEVYLMLQTRLKEAEVKDAVDSGDVRVLDAGLVPEDPVAPRPLVNVILGVILGLMVGLSTAFGRDLMNTKVRSRADAEQASAGAVLLGTIPRINPAAALGNGNGNGRARWRMPMMTGRRMAEAPEKELEERLVSRLDPRDPAAEAYRVLRTSLTFATPERPPQVLVVSSALPGDGRSITATNLAITFAQQGTRVLLVDADLRQGILHEVLHTPREPGLAHVLVGGATLDETLRRVPVGDSGVPLHFLSAGASPPNPAEMLGTGRLREVVAEMRRRYDIVIFDAPPLNLVTDAAVLGTVADAVVLVARNDTTERTSLDTAVRRLRSLRVPVAGVVLNDVPGADPLPYRVVATQRAGASPGWKVN